MFHGSKLIPGQKIKEVEESDTIYTFVNVSEHETLNFSFNEESPFTSN